EAQGGSPGRGEHRQRRPAPGLDDAERPLRGVQEEEAPLAIFERTGDPIALGAVVHRPDEAQALLGVAEDEALLFKEVAPSPKLSARHGEHEGLLAVLGGEGDEGAAPAAEGEAPPSEGVQVLALDE